MYVFFLELQRLPLNIGAKIPVFFVCFTDIVYICGKYTLYGKCTFPSHSSLLSVPYLYASFPGIRKCGNLFRWLPVAGSAGPATNDEQEGIFLMKKKEFRRCRIGCKILIIKSIEHPYNSCFRERSSRSSYLYLLLYEPNTFFCIFPSCSLRCCACRCPGPWRASAPWRICL